MLYEGPRHKAAIEDMDMEAVKAFAESVPIVEIRVSAEPLHPDEPSQETSKDSGHYQRDLLSFQGLLKEGHLLLLMRKR